MSYLYNDHTCCDIWRNAPFSRPILPARGSGGLLRIGVTTGWQQWDIYCNGIRPKSEKKRTGWTAERGREGQLFKLISLAWVKVHIFPSKIGVSELEKKVIWIQVLKYYVYVEIKHFSKFYRCFGITELNQFQTICKEVHGVCLHNELGVLSSYIFNKVYVWNSL